MQNLLTFIRTELWLAVIRSASNKMAWATSSLSPCDAIREWGFTMKAFIDSYDKYYIYNAFNHLDISFFKKSSVNVSLIMYSKHCLPCQVWVSSVSISTNRKVGESASISFFLCMKHKLHATCHLIYDIIINSK